MLKLENKKRWKNCRGVNCVYQNSKGITLIALIITIIVMLILTTVTITSLLGDDGIIARATSARIETVIATIKENLHIEELEKMIDGEKITPETLLAEGRVKRILKQAEDEKYHIYYILKEDAVKGMQKLGKGNATNLKDVFIIDDNLNVKYIASNGREYGDITNDKILEDETKIRFANKGFSDFVSKLAGTEEENVKFGYMKNLTSLTINDQSVTSLEDLVFFPNLKSLVIGSYNINEVPQITSMDGVENCTKLNSITIIYGLNMDYTSIGELETLTSFSKRYGDGKDFDNIIDSLKSCQNLSTLSLEEMNISNMERINELTNNLATLNFQGNNISKIEGLENKKNITFLNLSNNDISKIEGLEELTKLQTLNLRK